MSRMDSGTEGYILNCQSLGMPVSTRPLQPSHSPAGYLQMGKMLNKEIDGIRLDGNHQLRHFRPFGMITGIRAKKYFHESMPQSVPAPEDYL